MALQKCRLCNRIYASESLTGHRICRSCIHKLEDTYVLVHEYIRDNEGEDFDIYSLAEATGISTAEIQAIADLGWLERDFQTYADTEKSKRERLAAALNAEIKKIEINDKSVTCDKIFYLRNKRTLKLKYE